jgi:hypothetical protein
MCWFIGARFQRVKRANWIHYHYVTAIRVSWMRVFFDIYKNPLIAITFLSRFLTSLVFIACVWIKIPSQIIYCLFKGYIGVWCWWCTMYFYSSFANLLIIIGWLCMQTPMFFKFSLQFSTVLFLFELFLLF